MEALSYIKAILFTVVAIAFIVLEVSALISGKLRFGSAAKGAEINKVENPIRFWVVIIVYAFAALVYISVSVKAWNAILKS